MRASRLFAPAAALLVAAPAAAQIEAAGPVRNDGVWTLASVTVPTGEQGEVAVQAGNLGGVGILYAGAEGRRRVGGGVALSAGYFHGRIAARGGNGETPVDLARLGATWTVGRPEGVEADGRFWTEWTIPRRRNDYVQFRPRLRLTAAVPGVLPAIKPRLFVANELFFRSDEGFDRNRVSAGLRAVFGRLDADLYWQGTDYERGPDIDSLVVQLGWRLGPR